MKDLFKQKSFLQSLFDAIPVLTFVLDKEVKVRAVNMAARKFLHCSETDIFLNLCGEVIGCRHTADDPRGCGYGPACSRCIIRNAALAARKGTVVERSKGKVQLRDDKEMNVLVSASSFEYRDEIYVVIMVEDISLIVELEGLIPICASCKRIRDDQGYWNRVEKYIEEHSEAEFTHDICPECIRVLYPGISVDEEENVQTA